MKRIALLLLFCSVYGIVNGQFRTRKAGDTSSDDGINYSNPREYEIAEIDVKGLTFLDKNALISLTGLKIGDMVKIPGDQISGAIKKLWNHGLVGDVSIEISKIEDDKVFLMIVLAERPRLTGFTFEGVSSGKETEIRKDLNLIRGRILTDAIVRNTEMAVKKYYVNKGFLNTEVKIIQTVDTVAQDGIRLKIIVDPKAKVRINKIIFEGNEAVGSGKLKKKLKETKEHPRIAIFKTVFQQLFSISPAKVREFVDSSYTVSPKELKGFVHDNFKLNFFNGSKFIKSDYEEDKIKLIAFYNTLGYRDATIISDSVYKHNEKTINVLLKVDEGNKYYFRDIRWTGNFVYNSELLNRVLDIKKGDVYNKELIEQRTSFNPRGPDISSLYMDDGYLFFNVNPIEVRIDNDSIDLEMRIYEGEQATINRVSVSGNEKTNDHVVMRELRTFPGQKFSRTDIIRTQQRLGQLGYFNPESINPDVKPNMNDGTVDITWEVEEQSSDQIELSGGWGGWFGFVGTVGLVFNNFSMKNIAKFKEWRPLPMGDGQRLQLRVQATGRQFQSYSFSFTEPWIGGKKPNSLSISYNASIIRSRSQFNTDGTPFTGSFRDFNSTLKNRGITIGLGKQLEWPDNYFSLMNSLSYNVYTLENFESFGQGGLGSLGFRDGSSTAFTFNNTLSRNSVDNPMYPSSGSTISLQVSLTPPYSLFRGETRQGELNFAERNRLMEYHKWMFDSKFYLPVVGKLVLEASAHIGLLGTYTSFTDVGPFERFSLGGDGLAGQGFFAIGIDIIGLRGYENLTITPPNYGLRQGGDNAMTGGTVYNKYSLELRYPITTGQAATIYGFTFLEGGNNWSSAQLFNPFDMYRSAGFGARIFMPAFGLIGINWAYGFDTLPGRIEPSGSQFHFTIGQQIR